MQPAAPGPRRYPRAFWTAVVVCVLTMGAGVLVAVLGYARSTGPDSVVRDYFAALARADASTALAYGDLPAGPRTLLTDDVLRGQQRAAPIRDVTIAGVQRSGRAATVRVDYTIAFAEAPQAVHDTVRLYAKGDTWRLGAVAVATEFELLSAAHRATVAGAAVPRGTMLAFPGAVPISFDTPYLELTAADDYLTFATLPLTQVFVRLSDAGRKAVVAAAARSLGACFGARSAASQLCPAPSGQYVPGRLRGTLTGTLDTQLGIDVARVPDGTLEIDGTVVVRGSYQRISFDGRLEAGRGTVRVAVSGQAFPVAPAAIRWLRPS